MRDDIIIAKIIGYAKTIEKYCAGLDHGSFLDSGITIDACVFNLSQIGELAGKVSIEEQNKRPEIQWKQIRGLRNRIVHDYEGVNKELIWEIIEGDIPTLISNLKKK